MSDLLKRQELKYKKGDYVLVSGEITQVKYILGGQIVVFNKTLGFDYPVKNELVRDLPLLIKELV